jgi:vacuolar-type H+-ATPase subunit H
MALSLNDVIKKIVDAEKEKNVDINKLKLSLDRKYQEFVASKDSEKSKFLDEIETEYSRIISEAEEKAEQIIESAEERKIKEKERYEDLINKNEDLAKKIISLLLR